MLLDALEVEKNSLIQHNKILNERIDNEREKNGNLQENISKLKTHILRLEAKIRKYWF